MAQFSSYMQNRELSWLRFNERILEEASDATVPLLERMKFIEIFSSNLDEFFMIRVGRLLTLSRLHPDETDPKSGMTASQQLHAIYQAVRPLYVKREHCFFDILKTLPLHDIHCRTFSNLTKEDRKFVRQSLKQSVLPFLSPQIVDAHHPFPHLQNKTLHIVTRLKYKGKETFGCIPIPSIFPDVLFLPGSDIRFVFLGDILMEYIGQLFPGYSCLEAVQLRVTRNSDLHMDNCSGDPENDFRSTMRNTLRNRTKLSPVRLELSHPVTEELKQYLHTKLILQPHQIYVTQVPLNLRLVQELGKKLSDTRRSILSYPPYTPQLPSSLCHGDTISGILHQRDILLSYPYESMRPFLQFIKEAASDPSVLSIKIAIYRLNSKATLVNYLCTAAENGKDVTVLIELRARFDEQNNIDWSERLEEAGCTVIYGFPDYKVHAKICSITKNDHGTVRYLTQIGTGNYNEKTATMYTDLSLLTADPAIGKDANAFFKNMMIGNLNGTYKHLLVAPTGLKPALLSLMDQEIAKGEHGRILLKLNSLTDLDIMEKLREASKAHVQVTMIVRSICCLLPGVPGETENLHIRSIVGRFLEHSRIYCFGFGSEEKLFIASADFMTRNTQRRVEIACPIYDADVRNKIHHILDLCLQDNLRARQLQPNGSYAPIDRHNLPSLDCQQQLMDEALTNSSRTVHKNTFIQKLKTMIRRKRKTS